MRLTRAFDKRMRAAITAALALATACALCFPAQAFAYFAKDPVGVYLGAGSLSLTSGQTGTVSVSVDMWSEQQLPGCGMAECPQACGNLTTPWGEVGGCLNAAGWCQCAGTSYITAYTTLSVSSSNPSVARATVSGGVLSVQAYSAGTCTLTVYSSLSKHREGSTTMTVNVSDPVSAAPSGGGASGGSGSGGGSSGGGAPSGGGASGGYYVAPSGNVGGGSGSGSDSGGSGGVSVSAAGASATAAAAAAASSGGGEQRTVVEMEAENGAKVIVVEATDTAAAAEELAKIKGTEGTCTFWSGGTLESPAISWTFKGADLSDEDDLNVDPAVSVTEKGSGDVAELLADVGKSIVMDFAHTGDLPGPAEVYVRTSGVYEDGAVLGLYRYDEDAKRFRLEQEGVEAKDGYAVFSIDHCSTWALSDEDLAALGLPEDEADEDGAAGADDAAGEVDASQVDVHAQDGAPYLIAGAAALAVAAAVAAGVLVARRRRAAAASEEEGAGEAGAADAGAEDEAGEAERSEDGETSGGDASEAGEAAVDDEAPETSALEDDEAFEVASGADEARDGDGARA